MGYCYIIVLCDANVVMEDDRRRSRLPNAPLDAEYDSSSMKH